MRAVEKNALCFFLQIEGAKTKIKIKISVFLTNHLPFSIGFFFGRKPKNMRAFLCEEKSLATNLMRGKFIMRAIFCEHLKKGDHFFIYCKNNVHTYREFCYIFRIYGRIGSRFSFSKSITSFVEIPTGFWNFGLHSIRFLLDLGFFVHYRINRTWDRGTFVFDGKSSRCHNRTDTTIDSY